VKEQGERVAGNGERDARREADANGLSYAIYDVFTDTPLSGNPLAVVFGGDGLSDDQMQSVAQEFNLSETVFVLAPESGTHAARLRIFTPVAELPFAGHPTVGAAVAIAHRRNREHANGGHELDTVIMLEEKVGAIRSVVKLANGRRTSDAGVARHGFAEFDLPRLAAPVACTLKRDAIAEALGVSPRQIGFENHIISAWSAGVPYVMVPMHDVAAVGQCRCDAARWEALAPIHQGILADAFVYCRGGIDHGADFHARMFAPTMGIAEDPATGSAVAALSGAIMHFDAPLDGHHSLKIEQGVEMGRPSRIHLHMDVAKGAVARARIGGDAVQVAEGRIWA
jgi:trans-2,3-dihydro-3-hydroxyanthranilate isomerase